MRSIPILVCSVALIGASAGFGLAQAGLAQATAAKPSAPAQSSAPQSSTHIVLPPVPKPLLPDSFAGWVATGPLKRVTDPAEADPLNTAALKEYDFTEGALAIYKRGNETLSLRALRFHDASGAYGAYSFYRQTGWPKEEIGTGAASNHNRVLFWLGNTMVDANFNRIGPMSGSELRELAGRLPLPAGTAALTPPILADLPHDSLDGQTTHYAVGPAGYVAAGGVLPPDVVGFDRGAEAVTANYTLRSGPATLTIIDYPTPHQDSDAASLEVRRSGPLVALVSGDAIPDESHKLLAVVHYDADLMSIPQPTESEVSKTSKLLMGIATMVIIGASAAVLLGFFLGGGRALYRLARGRPISSVYEAEFTSLHLRD